MLGETTRLEALVHVMQERTDELLATLLAENRAADAATPRPPPSSPMTCQRAGGLSQTVMRAASATGI